MKTFTDFMDHKAFFKIEDVLSWLPPIMYWPSMFATLFVAGAAWLLRYLFVPQRLQE